MTDQVPRRLSAALHAQASRAGSVGGKPARAARARPGWVILSMAVVLGALAGGLAGVISIW